MSFVLNVYEDPNQVVEGSDLVLTRVRQPGPHLWSALNIRVGRSSPNQLGIATDNVHCSACRNEKATKIINNAPDSKLGIFSSLIKLQSPLVSKQRPYDPFRLPQANGTESPSHPGSYHPHRRSLHPKQNFVIHSQPL